MSTTIQAKVDDGFRIERIGEVLRDPERGDWRSRLDGSAGRIEISEFVDAGAFDPDRALFAVV